ncbi:autotransporter domain-containing protein [Fusobacterium perfoetens]|uniref:autotransporter domain-containing protein n=1 Tax=Fusobacterium perfoetens TaxID=852 RepID=UPI0026F0CC76|nr:autotransporter serine protease [Fusobacterium perfoetens]
MKIKRKYIKNPLFQVALVLLLTSCGGGGGGSAPIRDNNMRPIIVPERKPDVEIKPEINPVVNPEVNPDKDTNKVNGIVFGKGLPSNLTYSKPQIKVEAHEGKGLVVGILDSDFVKYQDRIGKKYGDKGVEIDFLPKGNDHHTYNGEGVLDTLLQGVTPKVVASSLSENDNGNNIIRYNLEDYKKILKKMKENDGDGPKKLKVFNQSWGSNLDYIQERNFFGNKDRLTGKVKLNEEQRNTIYRAFSSVKTGDVNREIIPSGKEAIDFYEEAIKNENALFVWANGNYDGGGHTITNGQLQSAAPLLRSSLERGWISVVGVDGKNNNKDYDAHLAYAGAVKDWAISAPGESTLNYENNSHIGSSFAAPRVTNAALQVASKFDWMTNNDVRLTLFTTTNKVGVGDGETEENRYIDFEPTGSHGWGVLNLSRALKGPGAFIGSILKADYKNKDSKDYNLYFNANIPEGKTSYFENNIFGNAGLKKKGEGTLVLTGENTFSGKSKIEDGKLEIYKKHRSGIDIEKNGTLVLHNNASVGFEDLDSFSIVTNSGTLNVVGKEAYIENYKNDKGKIHLKENSHLNIKKADVENLHVSVYSDNYVSPKEKKVELIKADELVGNIKDVEINGMRKISLDRENNNLVASISRENAVDYLGDAPINSKDTARKIEITLKELDEKYNSGNISEEEKELGNGIISMSVNKFKNATEIVSGEIYASAQALSFVQAQNINKSLSNHLGSLKDFYNSDYEWQGWSTFQSSSGKLKEDGYISADTKINGGHFGIDKRVGNSQVGVALSYGKGYGDFENYGGKYRSNSIGISLYEKEYFADNFYTLGRIGITHFDTTVDRALLTRNGDVEFGRIKHGDNMVSAYLEVGKHFEYITPYIGYSMDYLRRGDFNESSADWGIVANDKDYFKQNLIFGLQGEQKVSDVTFNYHLSQLVNIGDRDLSFKGHFTDSTTVHTFKGINQVKNTSWIGAGVTKEFTENFGVSVNLDIRLEEFKSADTVYSTKMYFRF